MNVFVQLDSESNVSMYEQLYQYIKQKIIDGDFSKGEKLPSTRMLATNLGVSRNTVERAYDQLVAEGYVEAKPCSGYRVCNIEGLFLFPAKEISSISIGEKKYEGFLCDFTKGGIDEESFPIDNFRKVGRSVLSEQEQFLCSGDSFGEYELRKEISNYLQGARGVRCTPEQIVVGAGNDYLLMLLTYILQRDNIVAMEYPSYTQAYRVLNGMKCQIVNVEMDESGMSVDKLKETDANLVYVMPSHQFPTGIVMPMSRRLALLRWAYEEPWRYIIEDDYDSELRYKGKPIPALQGFDEGECVIYLGTFSQSIAPSVRVSYMVLPQKLVEDYLIKCGSFSNTVARVQQQTIRAFMEEGYFERHLNRMRKKYKEKRDIILGTLKKVNIPIAITGAEAGTHLLLNLPSNLDADEIISKGADNNIRLSKVVGMENTILLAYGGSSKNEIEKGAEILAKVLLL